MSALDDALAGNLDAIEENFRQMIGALHNVDTTAPAFSGFVDEPTLDKLADFVLFRIDAEGRIPVWNGAGRTACWIGQGVDAHVSRGEREDTARISLKATDARAFVEPGTSFVVRHEVPAPANVVLYVAPPALAVRAWARRRLAS